MTHSISHVYIALIYRVPTINYGSNRRVEARVKGGAHHGIALKGKIGVPRLREKYSLSQARRLRSSVRSLQTGRSGSIRTCTVLILSHVKVKCKQKVRMM